MVYEPRFYRQASAPVGLTGYRVVLGETDLHVFTSRDLSAEARQLVRELRGDIERHIAAYPRFGESFVPIEVDSDAPAIVRAMADAALAAGVGPMAAVAGAIAEGVARGLEPFSPQVIVENGGDIYLMGTADRTVALWAGSEAAAGLGVRIRGARLPLSVCTSSGRIGHSVSLGDADSATAIARGGALADAVATALGNRVRGHDDLAAAATWGCSVPGVEGVLVTIDGAISAMGAVELVSIR